jgi:hypothetical protein
MAVLWVEMERQPAAVRVLIALGMPPMVLEIEPHKRI